MMFSILFAQYILPQLISGLTSNNSLYTVIYYLYLYSFAFVLPIIILGKNKEKNKDIKKKIKKIKLMQYLCAGLFVMYTSNAIGMIFGRIKNSLLPQ